MGKLKTLILSLKLLENTFNKHYPLLEDQLLAWIYKNSNNSEENSTQVSLIKAEEVVQIKVAIK